MSIKATKAFERPHISAGIYPAKISGWRTTKDDGTPLKTQFGEIGVIDFDILNKKGETVETIGRPVSLKISEASILGKIFIASGIQIVPNKEYNPTSLIGKEVQCIVSDTWTKPKIGQPEQVSEIKDVMKIGDK